VFLIEVVSQLCSSFRIENDVNIAKQHMLWGVNLEGLGEECEQS